MKKKIFRFLVAIVLIATCLLSCTVKVQEEELNFLCDNYTKEELLFFSAISFGTERNNAGMDAELKRWQEDVKIKVFGEPAYPEDLQTLKRAITKLNEVIDPIEISLTQGSDYNIEFHFASVFDAEKIMSKRYIFGAAGQFQFHAAFGNITSGKILISHEAIPDVRTKLIWEETIQVLGMGNDIDLPYSVFDDKGTKYKKHFKEPLPIDLQVIRILYNSGIPTRLKRKDFLEAIALCNN